MDNDICERLREFLNTNDRFCAVNGIRIEKLSPGFAEAVLDVTPDKLNGVGVVQGGAIFTLIDLAFAGAANSGNVPTVAMTSSINFLRPGAGGRLRAVAHEVNRGRRTTLCTIEVFDERGKLVAQCSTTGFIGEGKMID